jgi:AmiR/NasT family two-component response regulator
MTAGSRIVIAEDEAIIRMDLREILEEEGYQVVGEATDGASALALAQELRPDLVILDIVMPGLDGLSAAQHIVEQELAAVLILTAFSQRELVTQATQAGAMAYLVKPFEKSDLVPAIEVAVARWDEARALAQESRSLAERLETRKLVERAKGVLMDRHALSEQDAFRLIQQAAMRGRIGMKEAAERVLGGDVMEPAPNKLHSSES